MAQFVNCLLASITHTLSVFLSLSLGGKVDALTMPSHDYNVKQSNMSPIFRMCVFSSSAFGDNLISSLALHKRRNSKKGDAQVIGASVPDPTNIPNEIPLQIRRSNQFILSPNAVSLL